MGREARLRALIEQGGKRGPNMVVVPDSVRGELGRGKRPQEVGGSGGSSKEQQEPGGLQFRKAGDFPEVTLMVRKGARAHTPPQSRCLWGCLVRPGRWLPGVGSPNVCAQRGYARRRGGPPGGCTLWFCVGWQRRPRAPQWSA